MKIYQDEGIILKRFNYSEADRILTVFTKNHGKLTAIAKGVRKPLSKRSGLLEQFNRVRLGLVKGKTFEIVTETQLIEDFRSDKFGLEQYGLACQACELVDELLKERQEQDRVYKMLLYLLRQFKLNCNSNIETQDFAPLQIDLKNLLIRFENMLLVELGFSTKEKRLSVEEVIEKELKSRKFLNKLENALGYP